MGARFRAESWRADGLSVIDTGKRIPEEVAHCRDPEDARDIVDALNASRRPFPATPAGVADVRGRLVPLDHCRHPHRAAVDARGTRGVPDREGELMKCHIEHDWLSDTFHVFLFARATGGQTLVVKHVEGDVWRDELVPEGTKTEPTFSLRRDWLEAFVKEASKIPTADDATVAHLKDTRETRDRLLAIVEHKMGVSSAPRKERPDA